MAIIKQYDKRSGITYVYESHSFWDPDKKMTRAKRTLIGRLNPDTGEVVPTDGRNRKTKATPAEEPADYKKLLRKSKAQEALIVSLKKQLEELKK